MGLPIKELVVVSGKGGTGKTSITGALATLIPDKVLADCDVDAANLQLILGGEQIDAGPFESGWEISVDSSVCIQCSKCGAVCQFGAIDNGKFSAPLLCEGCGVCADHCPTAAIAMQPRNAGEWKTWQTPYGMMATADLGVAIENSGKLVCKVKGLAREMATENSASLILTDGPPGIGCPAIAAITGASLVLAVVEPTLSALHDVQRLFELTEHFKIPLCVCINKSDLHTGVHQQILDWCATNRIQVAGEISYRDEFRQALQENRTVMTGSDEELKSQIVKLWQQLGHQLANSNKG
jgi:MinD superfamily P-loop ATPase